MTEDERQKWLEGAEYYGSPLEDNTKVPFVEEDEIDETVAMPSLRYSADPMINQNATPLGFRQVTMKTFFNPIRTLRDEVSAATSDLTELKAEIDARISTADADHAQAVSDTGRAATDHATAVSDSSRAATDHNQAVSDSQRAASDHSQAVSDTEQASADHLQSVSDSSRAASDHQTATSDTGRAALDHQQSVSDSQRASTDHSTAVSDSQRAASDHQQAETDHAASTSATNAANTAAAYAMTQGDFAKNVGEHPSYVADGTEEKPGDIGYVYEWDYSLQHYVRGVRLSLDYSTMTQAQIDALVDQVKEGLVFASVQTCEDIITELT